MPSKQPYRNDKKYHCYKLKIRADDTMILYGTDSYKLHNTARVDTSESNEHRTK